MQVTFVLHLVTQGLPHWTRRVATWLEQELWQRRGESAKTLSNVVGCRLRCRARYNPRVTSAPGVANGTKPPSTPVAGAVRSTSKIARCAASPIYCASSGATERGG